ncbi:Golgin imh1 [Elasticomyces elasticus]
MFNRLKGFNLDSFLDSKIAEEQAKQGKPAQGPPSAKRTPSNVGPRRSSARPDSPARRAGSRLRVQDGDGVAAGKGPDPEEFVIGDDASDVSRAATPRPVKEGTQEPLAEAGKAEEKTDESQAVSKGKERAESDELPDDVRKKLAKLENLTTKYQGMQPVCLLHRGLHPLFYSQNILRTDLLRNYRTAHARVSSIEPFEATLREHTPLTSISEPGALIEFLNQKSVQSDMVLEELKRISVEHKGVVNERDELKTKLEEAEKKAKDAFDEAAGLREQQSAGKHGKESAESDLLGVNEVNEQNVKPTGDDDDFFSYDAEQTSSLQDEIKKHLAELHEQKEYINELSTENATLRKDFDMCELNLKAMENKVGVKERHLSKAESERDEAKESLEAAEKAREEAQEQEQEAAALLVQTEGEVVHLQEKLKKYQRDLQDREQELHEKATLAEENLRKYQSEHAENLKRGTYTQRDEKGMESLRNLVKTLREQSDKAEQERAQAQGQAKELQHELKKLESEADVRGDLLAKLRDHEAVAESYKRKMTDAEHERDEVQRIAETKKGHEAAAASLRSQLKNAVKDRDAAYQMILDCGKCKPPAEETASMKPPETPTQISTPETRSRGASETTERTEVSTQPTEVSTPSVNGEADAADAKKKNKKKKSKSKKKTTADAPADTTASATPAPPVSLEELIAQPAKARELLVNEGANSELMMAFVKHMVANIQEETKSRDDGSEEVIRHHEQVIEERDQTIRDRERMIQDHVGERQRIILAMRKAELAFEEREADIEKKEDEISRLQSRLKGEEELREEIETLRDDLTELGSQATNAKHELKALKEQKAKLQEESDDLQSESDKTNKSLKDAEAQRQDLADRCKVLEKEMIELRSTHSAASSSSMEELKAVREQLATIELERKRLVADKVTHEKQIEEIKAHSSASSAENDVKHKSLSADFDELKAKAAALDKDLAAANELAQTRFKDLTDLRAHLNTVQPELKRLRDESAELKTVKSDLDKANASLKRLESKEKDLRSEIAEYKSQAAGKDSEIASLKDVAKKSEERSSALEDSYEHARQDLEQSQSKRDEATDARDKLQSDLKRMEEELKRSKSSLDDLEKQANKLRNEANGFRDELQMTRAQQASAQSLMDSQQDQSRELAIQMREIRERNESLEEELADAHRLLSERSREGETMRRMLAEVEARADSRVKDMRERMDLAIEERDRAEDEASAVGRRKTREMEELKTKLKDAERDISKATEARKDIEQKEQQAKERHTDLEKRAAQAQEELAEVRSAMTQLRDAVHESERQTAVLEREKADLRKELEDRSTRLDKLQKSSKTMSEELRSLQSSNKLRQGSVQSSRSSLESTPVASPRITSPPPRGTSNGTTLSATGKIGSAASDSIDYRYIKNVLLQFLEQKEKKHQMQLVPVLGMLLHFDK